MNKNDTTKQLNMLKLNQMRFLTDLWFQLQALKDATIENTVRNHCNEIDLSLQEKIAELTKLPIK